METWGARPSILDCLYNSYLFGRLVPDLFLGGIRRPAPYLLHMMHTRRRFIRLVPTLGAFAVPVLAPPPSSLAAISGQAPAPEGPLWPSPEPVRGAPVDDSFPSQHVALAKEIVGVSHGNLARVRELVQQHPALATASFDWGYGDWETALGAASHTGRREIAELLIENGAPPTLFSATMLGQLDLVKAFLAAMPGGQRMRGPHSISLMTHAKLGGPQAAPVVKYFESLGDADLPMKDEPLTDQDRAQLDGRYTFGDRPRDTFKVVTTPKEVSIERLGATPRNFRHLGDLAFYPPGAPQVRIRFEREGGKIAALTVSDPDLVVRARKQG
jgi:hypothetical protein